MKSRDNAKEGAKCYLYQGACYRSRSDAARFHDPMKFHEMEGISEMVVLRGDSREWDLELAGGVSVAE